MPKTPWNKGSLNPGRNKGRFVLSDGIKHMDNYTSFVNTVIFVNFTHVTNIQIEGIY